MLTPLLLLARYTRQRRVTQARQFDAVLMIFSYYLYADITLRHTRYTLLRFQPFSPLLFRRIAVCYCQLAIISLTDSVDMAARKRLLDTLLLLAAITLLFIISLSFRHICHAYVDISPSRFRLFYAYADTMLPPPRLPSLATLSCHAFAATLFDAATLHAVSRRYDTRFADYHVMLYAIDATSRLTMRYRSH